MAMPIRPELRPLYPPHWRELSSHVRFDHAEGRCQRCGRPHLVLLRCLPDGRWFDGQAATWRDRRGRPARWPDLMEATRFRMTRVVLAAAHLDSDPTNNRLKNSALDRVGGPGESRDEGQRRRAQQESAAERSRHRTLE
jgi:hypothetical protein